MEIKPFKAYRFNEAVVGDAGGCVSPPYDVINSEQADELYKKSQYNIVRVIKGKTQPADSEGNNQYTRAATYLNDWIKKGVLKQDSSETIYAYVQNFELAGQAFERLTFIALGKLEEFGKIVRPHEQTLSKPKIDRLNLQRATGATFGLVFMLYEDKKKIADKIIRKAEDQRPAIDFVDECQVRHRLFLISDKNDIEQITKMMDGKSVIIADGHHRYETGLNYYKETGKPAAAYQAMAFTNTRNEGLIILATHRVVSNLKDFDISGLIADLKENFEITEYKFDSKPDKTKAKQKMLSQMKAEYDKDKNAFGIYSGKGAFYTAVLKNKKAMDKAAGNMSSAWRSLDVAVLHKLILEGLLGIDEKKLAGESNIEYVKDTSTAIDDSIAKVDAGEKQVVFFMNPPKIEQIQKVADAGEKMPQKSTYFYPKMYTGLTVNKL
jgi:uncharacterized protein (DUF1015 family)